MEGGDGQIATGQSSDHGDATASLVLVTGPSGAGRSTAINALEDLGYEAIDNLPLSLIPRLLAGEPTAVPMALGIDPRNREFSTDAIMSLLDALEADPTVTADVLYLDCRQDVLIRRYSETRRRHPLAPAESPEAGIAREAELLEPVRARADLLIDTSDLTVHDLRADIGQRLARDGAGHLVVSVESFSYKRGLPRGVDIVHDVRFLANPHWEPSLRALDGRDAAVADYVTADVRFADFFRRVTELTLSLLPAYKDEGKTYLSIAVGCTGGQHRSVAVSERLAKTLADAGWQVSTRHRELERRGLSGNGRDMGKTS
ncbi:MAG: RNase adapter RapZ [Pseudomonadota bacterium]